MKTAKTLKLGIPVLSVIRPADAVPDPAPPKRKRRPAGAPGTALGRSIAAVIATEGITLRAAARRVGMSAAQLSRLLRGQSGVGAIHLANLIVRLKLDATQVIHSIYQENLPPARRR